MARDDLGGYPCSMADPLRTPPGTEDSFVLKCPLDEHDMESVKARNFTIDRCTRCGALWFDMAELQRIIAHGLPAVPVAHPLMPFACLPLLLCE